MKKIAFVFMALIGYSAPSLAEADLCKYSTAHDLLQFWGATDGRVVTPFEAKLSTGEVVQFEQTARPAPAPFYGLSIVKQPSGAYLCLLTPDRKIALRANDAFINDPTRGISPKASGVGLGLIVRRGTAVRLTPKRACTYSTQRTVCRVNRRGEERRCRVENVYEETDCRNGEMEFDRNERFEWSVVDSSGRELINFRYFD